MTWQLMDNRSTLIEMLVTPPLMVSWPLDWYFTQWWTVTNHSYIVRTNLFNHILPWRSSLNRALTTTRLQADFYLTSAIECALNWHRWRQKRGIVLSSSDEKRFQNAKSRHFAVKMHRFGAFLWPHLSFLSPKFLFVWWSLLLYYPTCISIRLFTKAI